LIEEVLWQAAFTVSGSTQPLSEVVLFVKLFSLLVWHHALMVSNMVRLKATFLETAMFTFGLDGVSNNQRVFPLLESPSLYEAMTVELWSCTCAKYGRLYFSLFS